MSNKKDEVSESGEAEDVPSDFFDDFTKDEFMEGLNVIDECWGEVNGASSQINQIRESRLHIDEEAVHGVKDLRELIGDNCDKSRMTPKYDNEKQLSPENSTLKRYIKPGSRRDPSKTNQAIKRDKEVKVQQFLAKTLESADELRPPGTELDGYYENDVILNEDEKSDNMAHSRPLKRSRRSPRRSPRRSLGRSPRRSPHHSQRHPPTSHPRRTSHTRISPRSRISPRERFRPRGRLSPHSRLSPRLRRGSPHAPVYSSSRHNPQQRRSPYGRSSHRYSPDRHSPRHHQRRSRSPHRQGRPRRSRSSSLPRSSRHGDSFLYPNNSEIVPGYPPGNPLYPPGGYALPINPEFPGYYPQAPAYGDGFSDPYNYGVPHVAQVPVQTEMMGSGNLVAAPPVMVPAPNAPTMEVATPYDALAQLVAEGKISQEDYLKLTPNKGVATPMDTKTRDNVLSRCNEALFKLKEKLLLPNRLVLRSEVIEADDKYLAPKYCSPLKRQLAAEFNFTKGSVSATQQTKQLVDSIVSTLGLDKVISKYKKKLPKDMKDAVIQTTKLQCEVCEIRESTKYHDVGTFTEPEYFTSTIHTQVVEEDLVSSKSIFNPSGSVGEGAAISIAHLTPAQLVSQLAARAKTLKQPQEPQPSSHFSRRPPSSYDYENRGGQYHPSYNSYRY